MSIETKISPFEKQNLSQNVDIEMESYENVQSQNAYETAQAASRPHQIPKQDNIKHDIKKTWFAVAISLGICFLVTVAAFILIMQLQNEMEHTKEKLDRMSEIDSSLANIINDTQKQQVETFKKLSILFSSSLGKLLNDTQKTSSSIKVELKNMKNEVSQLDSKIFIGDNKLTANLTEANSKIDKLLSIIGWFRASNNLFYKRFTDSVTYATAMARCEILGACLVSTGIRNNQVKKEIFPGHYLTGAYAWIGLDDISNEGIWVWSDGVNDSPSSWGTGEPNGDRGENCAAILFFNSKIGIADMLCSHNNRFVCEKEFA